MNKTTIEQLMECITTLVDIDAPWMEKRDTLLSELSKEDRVNFEEFLSWFESTD